MQINWQRLDEHQFPSSQFWDAWNFDKAAMRNAGYRPFKRDGVWYLSRLSGPHTIPSAYIKGPPRLSKDGETYEALKKASTKHKDVQRVSHPSQLDPYNPHSQSPGVDTSMPPWWQGD